MTTTHAPAPTTTDQPHTTHSGDRVELARYTTATGGRALIGQRIDGIVHVFDEPTSGQDTRYLVESGLERNSELQALVADYLKTAGRLDYPPMHGWF